MIMEQEEEVDQPEVKSCKKANGAGKTSKKGNGGSGGGKGYQGGQGGKQGYKGYQVNWDQNGKRQLETRMWISTDSMTSWNPWNP